MTFKELKAAVKGRFMNWGKYTAEKLENVSALFESTTTEDVGKVLTVGEDGSPEWEKCLSPIKILGRASGSATGVWDGRQECFLDIPSVYNIDTQKALMDINVTINEKSYHVDWLGYTKIEDCPEGISSIKLYAAGTPNGKACLTIEMAADSPAAGSIEASASFTVYTFSDMLAALQ